MQLMVYILYQHFLGVEVIINSGESVVPGKVGGLCGNFNGRPIDDYTKNSWPTGRLKQLLNLI